MGAHIIIYKYVGVHFSDLPLKFSLVNSVKRKTFSCKKQVEKVQPTELHLVTTLNMQPE